MEGRDGGGERERDKDREHNGKIKENEIKITPGSMAATKYKLFS